MELSELQLASAKLLQLELCAELLGTETCLGSEMIMYEQTNKAIAKCVEFTEPRNVLRSQRKILIYGV
jgi:hypothetical protein